MRLRSAILALATLATVALGGPAGAATPDTVSPPSTAHIETGVILCSVNSYTPSVSHSANTMSGSGEGWCSEQPSTMVFTVQLQVALTKYGTWRDVGPQASGYLPSTYKFVRVTTWCEPYSAWIRTKTYMSASIPGDTDPVTVYSASRWVTVSQC